jgi:hypothetical protein
MEKRFTKSYGETKLQPDNHKFETMTSERQDLQCHAPRCSYSNFHTHKEPFIASDIDFVGPQVQHDEFETHPPKTLQEGFVVTF